MSSYNERWKSTRTIVALSGNWPGWPNTRQNPWHSHSTEKQIRWRAQQTGHSAKNDSNEKWRAWVGRPTQQRSAGPGWWAKEKQLGRNLAAATEEEKALAAAQQKKKIVQQASSSGKKFAVAKSKA
jgi:hypothetical protein